MSGETAHRIVGTHEMEACEPRARAKPPASSKRGQYRRTRHVITHSKTMNCLGDLIALMRRRNVPPQHHCQQPMRRTPRCTKRKSRFTPTNTSPAITALPTRLATFRHLPPKQRSHQIQRPSTRALDTDLLSQRSKHPIHTGLVVLHILPLTLINLMISLPESVIQRLEHLVHLSG